MGKLDSLVDWCDKHLGGLVRLGPVTIFGFNAMHVTVRIRTRRWGYLSIHPTVRHNGAWWPWSIYLSPNATPWARTWGIGPGLRYSKRPQKYRRVEA